MSPTNEPGITLEQWAGSQYLGLTLLFTDIVESTTIGNNLGDNKWIKELFTHFNRARQIVDFFKYDCFTVKAIGDSLMMAFRRSSQAVEFATEFGRDTGVDHIGIRVGINSGEVQIHDNDIYGLNVNFTSRVQSSLPVEGVLVSNSVKRDYEKTFGIDSEVTFLRREVELRSFGRETPWKVRSRSLQTAIANQRKVRAALLGAPKIPSGIL